MNSIIRRCAASYLIAPAIALGAVSSYAQVPQATPPPPQSARSVAFPKPVEKTLPNGLRVIVVQRSQVPLVAAQVFIKSGGEIDPADLSGVADMTADLLTRGTTTKSAPQIAEALEPLGAAYNTGASWDSSTVGISVMSLRAGQALEILADIVRNPSFKDEDVERMRQRYLNIVRADLGSPEQIARLVAGRAVYGDTPYGHPLSGTLESIARIKREDIVRLHSLFYRPDNAILVIGGDMSPASCFSLAEKYFGDWQKPATELPKPLIKIPESNSNNRRILVIDMPAAGQAFVLAARTAVHRSSPDYFRGIVSNAVLTGYSGRLNQEIRVKRGLSYGARSSLDTRRWAGAFTAAASTKNDSGAQVAALALEEISKLTTEGVSDSELSPRKASLIGNFGRSLETPDGLVRRVGLLAIYGVSFEELNHFISNVQSIKPDDVKKFAAANLRTDGTSLVIVGDAKQFLPELRKRFADVEVIPVAELDLNSSTLRRAQ